MLNELYKNNLDATALRLRFWGCVSGADSLHRTSVLSVQNFVLEPRRPCFDERLTLSIAHIGDRRLALSSIRCSPFQSLPVNHQG